LTRKTALTDKLAGVKHSDDAFLALLRNDCDLDLAILNVEDSVSRISLSEDELSSRVFLCRTTSSDCFDDRLVIDTFNPSCPSCSVLTRRLDTG